MAKFMQNNELRSYLLKTNTKRLVECCTDKLWGNGLPLDDNNCLSPNRWFSQGLLGEILEHVQSSISDILGLNREESPTKNGTNLQMDTNATD